MIKFTAMLLVLLLPALARSRAQFDGGAPDDSRKAPEVFLQILNGIAPDPIDIEIEGKVVFPGLISGQRISAFGLPKNKLKLVLIHKATGNRKSIDVDLQKGYYTLILAGDFKALEIAEKVEKEEPPVRVFASIFKNGTGKGEAPVRVRVVNGMIDKPITVKGLDRKGLAVAPMAVEVAGGLPEKLMLEASMEGAQKRNLYLAQKAPAKNLSIVFYPAETGLAFRVMPETTPEGIASDQKEAEESEKKEAGNSSPTAQP